MVMTLSMVHVLVYPPVPQAKPLKNVGLVGAASVTVKNKN